LTIEQNGNGEEGHNGQIPRMVETLAPSKASILEETTPGF